MGLRGSELVTMRWDQINLKAGLVHVARLKNGLFDSSNSGAGVAGVARAAPHLSGVAVFVCDRARRAHDAGDSAQAHCARRRARERGARYAVDSALLGPVSTTCFSTCKRSSSTWTTSSVGSALTFPSDKKSPRRLLRVAILVTPDLFLSQIL
jgi:hypothetical protein